MNQLHIKAYPYTGGILALLWVAIFMGFQKTYFGVPWEHFFSISWYVHLHAVLGMLWGGLLLAQSFLIHRGQNSQHRLWGKTSYVLFPAFLLSMAPVGFFVWLRGDTVLLFSLFSNAVMLLLFYAGALYFRKQRAIHSRLMLATGLVLLDPALGRAAVRVFNLSPEWGNHLPFLVTDLILAALIWRERRQKQAFNTWVSVLACFLMYQLAAYRQSSAAPTLPVNTSSMDIIKIEHAEINAWFDLFAAQPESWAREMGAESTNIDGISVYICKKIPFPHFNVALDPGVRQPFSEQTLDAILGYFRQRGIGKFYLQSTPVTRPENAEDWYLKRGLRHVSSWHRIARGNGPLGEALRVANPYVVEAVTPATAPEWAQFIDHVYGMPTSAWLLQLVQRPGWYHMVCRQAGRIVAARSMKINPDHTAYFCIDAPIPDLMTQNFEADYVLNRRLVEIGLAQGVQLFCADIEKPSASHDTPAYGFWENLGFEVVYEKKNFMF